MNEMLAVSRPVARLFLGGGGGGQIGQILGPFMIMRGLSCDRVEFGYFGGGSDDPPDTPPPGYGPDFILIRVIVLSFCSFFFLHKVGKVPKQCLHRYFAVLFLG